MTINLLTEPMRWLVTGGCGFIGTNLIAHLLTENSQVNVRVLDNLSVATKQDLANVCTFTELDINSQDYQFSNDGYVELIVGDIRDYDVCLRCCKGVDIVIHLAASMGAWDSVENPKSDMEANVIGTFNLLEASRHSGVRKFIFASSGALIGDCEPPFHEELAPHPASPYGASKLAGEAYCSAHYRTFGLNTTSLRFGNVYGPRSKHKSSVVSKFIKLAMKNEPLEIYGDGQQTRDFIYIDDLIRAIFLAVATDGIGGNVFQIATNAETTINELMEALRLILSEKGLNDIMVQHVAPRIGEVRCNFLDTSKAKQKLGWQAEVDLPAGLKRNVEWFLENSP